MRYFYRLSRPRWHALRIHMDDQVLSHISNMLLDTASGSPRGMGELFQRSFSSTRCPTGTKSPCKLPPVLYPQAWDRYHNAGYLHATVGNEYNCKLIRRFNVSNFNPGPNFGKLRWNWTLSVSAVAKSVSTLVRLWPSTVHSTEKLELWCNFAQILTYDAFLESMMSAAVHDTFGRIGRIQAIAAVTSRGLYHHKLHGTTAIQTYQKWMRAWNSTTIKVDKLLMLICTSTGWAFECGFFSFRL